MKIIFMGTPEFAKESLAALWENSFDVAAVFTRPDRPAGRGLKTESSPVKLLAQEKNIPVYQPASLKNNPENLKIIQKIRPDLIVVVAYGMFLPQEILDLPKLGCINLHASLLPKYRGAAPIQRAILNGEKITGLSIIFLNQKMDAGDIIQKGQVQGSSTFPIGPEETAGQLESRLARAGAKMLAEIIPEIEKGQIKRIPQDENLATLAPAIKKEEAQIDWSQNVEKIVNKIRAFNPRPGAFSHLDKKIVKILRAQVVPENSAELIDLKADSAAAGTILKISPGQTIVKTGAGSLNLQEIQFEGKKSMPPFDYSIGRQLKPGDIFIFS